MTNVDRYLIEDLLPNNPFESIYEKRKEDIFYEYMAYRDYYNFLKIISKRLEENYGKYREIQPLVASVMENLREKTNPDDALLIRTQSAIMTEIQLDQESFIIFTQILLNKLGMLVEKLCNSRSENNYTHSFMKHKNWFIDKNINPMYSGDIEVITLV